ncbi:MAG: hypothetical protein J6T73_00400, partial [Clostridia bacterium]|nr:hypothetical protein [Clostridia bacterium]
GIIVAIPFLLVTLFALLLGLKQVFVCRIDYAVVILGFLIGTYTYFYFEPMFEGAKWLFYAFCFIFGMMSQIDRYQSIQKKLATVGR